jgi:N-acetylmuramoyl-L-alanine amidase
LNNARFSRREPPVEVNDGVIGRVDFVQDGAQAKLVAKLHPSSVSSEIQKFNEPPRIVLDIRPKGASLGLGSNQKDVLSQPIDWNVEPEPRSDRSSLTTIVIDPGHGGRDVGARGKGGLLEKDVALDVALRLKQVVEKTPGMKVILTRNNDYFVSLEERTVMANNAKEGKPADLFISIHTNSHKSSAVDGFEAFYISDKFDPGAEATAAMENAVVALEKEGKKGADSSLSPILWDLQFTEFISESSELAFIAQEKLGGRLNSRNRGVRQAKFIVLSGVAMPSVLLELGFISNRVEEAEMKTNDYRDKCAGALADAIFHFKERHDARLGLLDGKTTH